MASLRGVEIGEVKTVLSGDIGIPGDDSDNSLHVVKAENVGTNAVLTGFHVVDGNADGGKGGDAAKVGDSRF